MNTSGKVKALHNPTNMQSTKEAMHEAWMVPPKIDPTYPFMCWG